MRSASGAERLATPDDLEAITAVWHAGWREAHLGHVPAALEQHRGFDDLRERVRALLADTLVTVIDSQVVGFVAVDGDEIQQMYVAASARGSDVASALLRHGEQRIARRFDRAWLAVVAGNARARRFYERNGWVDAGAFDYAAKIDGGTLSVPCHRYEKDLTASTE